MNKDGKLFFKAINKAEDICLVVMFAVMVAAIFLQVIMRAVFNNPLSWSEELGKFVFVWLSWFGISIGERKNEHIRITMVLDKLPAKWRKILEIIANLFLVIILVVTLYYGCILVYSQSHVHYAGIKISVGWGYLSVVLGCAFMLLRIFGKIVQNIAYLKRGDVNSQNDTLKGGAN